ncbi:unnamed protein product [Pleuronectes platessa]|uniref:Uncharacterized protein n=1 Tax=Pleuronectes platessa TaxID=8262 RepID=A0A9N7ZD01_PLEPL|nr:unnamed protein product [Pleuronectes platessa]
MIEPELSFVNTNPFVSPGRRFNKRSWGTKTLWMAQTNCAHRFAARRECSLLNRDDQLHGSAGMARSAVVFVSQGRISSPRSQGKNGRREGERKRVYLQRAFTETPARRRSGSLKPGLSRSPQPVACVRYLLPIGNQPRGDNDQRVYMVCGSNGSKGADLPPTQSWNLPETPLVCDRASVVIASHTVHWIRVIRNKRQMDSGKNITSLAAVAPAAVLYLPPDSWLNGPRRALGPLELWVIEAGCSPRPLHCQHTGCLLESLQVISGI